MDLRDRIVGCLLGGAVGDAIGLPYEGLSPQRALRAFGPPDRHRFFLGRGMVSDDTEHACLTAQAVIATGDDLAAFQRRLAWGLRFWLLGLPAGAGLATLRAALKLWIGFGPKTSGVFSAGNGAAMRAPILGVAIGNPARLRDWIRASTEITHTDPRAEVGAFAIAMAANAVARNDKVAADQWFGELRSVCGDLLRDALAPIERAVQAAGEGVSTAQFVASLGLSQGVTGFIDHTAPVAIHVWLTHSHDYQNAIETVVKLGGDTDTTAAIVGGIIGAAVGRTGIPDDWLAGLMEWPRTVGWMERLGDQLAETLESKTIGQPIRLPLVGLLPRNLLFAAVVLGHGFRRLAPF